jgi:hypothetical protein
MGLLFNWFLKDTNTTISLNHSKLKAHFNHVNGLYKNLDGSEPSLEDFEKHGFSEEEYFLAVYGQTQEELQNRMMRKYAEKRTDRLNTINKRLILNSKREMQNKPIRQSKEIKNNLTSLAMFAPFGIYQTVLQNNSFNTFIEDSMTLTGSPLGLIDLLMGENPNGGMFDIDSGMDNLNDQLNEILNTDQNPEFFSHEMGLGASNSHDNPF